MESDIFHCEKEGIKFVYRFGATYRTSLVEMGSRLVQAYKGRLQQTIEKQHVLVHRKDFYIYVYVSSIYF